MKSRHMQAFSWAMAVCLALSGLLAAGCHHDGEEAVQVTRDAEGDAHVKVDGDQVDKNLEQAGEELKAGAEQVKEAASVTGAASSQVLAAAQELAQHSSNLGGEVRTFISNVQAA